MQMTILYMQIIIIEIIAQILLPLMLKFSLVREKEKSGLRRFVLLMIFDTMLGGGFDKRIWSRFCWVEVCGCVVVGGGCSDTCTVCGNGLKIVLFRRGYGCWWWLRRMGGWFFWMSRKFELISVCRSMYFEVEICTLKLLLIGAAAVDTEIYVCIIRRTSQHTHTHTTYCEKQI